VTFGERLEKLMHERRPPLTQHALAERVGVTQSAVSDWLRRSRIPHDEHLNKICAALGVRREWLLTGDGDKDLPNIYIVQEIPTGYTRREKLAFIEENFPEALPMLDSFLVGLCREVAPAADRHGSHGGSSPGKKVRRVSRPGGSHDAKGRALQ
jgi:transcriptional regulator with XRE-family HTH domain